MYYSYIGVPSSGLTNQLFYLTGSIIVAITKGEKVIVVDKFLTDYSKKNYLPISQIFDMKKFNEFLHGKYGVVVVDKYNVDFKINYIKYGTDAIYHDFTSYYTYPIRIKKKTIFNSIYGDPCPNVHKQLIINYTINGYNVQEIHPENLKKNIVIHFEGAKYVSTFSWINSYDETMFENILSNIPYDENFMIEKHKFFQRANLNKDDKINVIHLRLEDDALKHWSTINHLSKMQFKRLMKKKYIDLIKKYIDKTDYNIILSWSKKNPVYDFLQREGYQILKIDKLYDRRELNAIFELLVSSLCNNKVIGNFNFKNINGSSFSYYMCKLMNSNVEKIMIDLDHIHNSEQVFTSFSSIRN